MCLGSCPTSVSSAGAQVKHFDKRLEEDVSAENLPRFLHVLLAPTGSQAGLVKVSLQRSSAAAVQPEVASPGDEGRRRRR